MSELRTFKHSWGMADDRQEEIYYVRADVDLELANLRAERDAMLAALKAFVAANNSDLDDWLELLDAACKQAKAAIKEVGG